MFLKEFKQKNLFLSSFFCLLILSHVLDLNLWARKPSHLARLSPFMIKQYLVDLKFSKEKTSNFVLKVCLSNMALRHILKPLFLVKGVFDKQILWIFKQCLFFYFL